MNTTPDDHVSAAVAGRLRRDRALRLRRRLVMLVAAGSTAAVGGFAVLAEHTAAGTSDASISAAPGSTSSGSESRTAIAVTTSTSSGSTSSGSSQSATPTAPAAPTAVAAASASAHAVSGGS
jgi:hypothetical protein